MKRTSLCYSSDHGLPFFSSHLLYFMLAKKENTESTAIFSYRIATLRPQ